MRQLVFLPSPLKILARIRKFQGIRSKCFYVFFTFLENFEELQCLYKLIVFSFKLFLKFRKVFVLLHFSIHLTLSITNPAF